jgi:hypothetical protein
MMDLVSLLDLEGWITGIVDLGARALGLIVVAAWLAWKYLPQTWTDCLTAAFERFPCA